MIFSATGDPRDPEGARLHIFDPGTNGLHIFDQTGTNLWERSYPFMTVGSPYAAIVGLAGEVAVAGAAPDRVGSPKSDAVVARFDAQGNLLGATRFSPPSAHAP